MWERLQAEGIMLDPRGPKEDFYLFLLVLTVFSTIYLCFK